MAKKNPFKRIQSAVKKYTPVGIVYDKAREAIAGKKESGGTTPGEAAEADRQKGLDELSGVEAEYQKIGDQARAGAEEEAKKAGTWADTPAARSALQSEADARGRGLKHAARGRINAIRARLGMPEMTA